DTLLTRCRISTCEDRLFQEELSQTGSQPEGFAKITTAQRRNMPKKIDPLNKKQYGAVTAMLTVADVKAAVSFYQKAFGFAKRGIMNGPDGKPMHAELTLRGTTLMQGPGKSGTCRPQCQDTRSVAGDSV